MSRGMLVAAAVVAACSMGSTAMASSVNATSESGEFTFDGVDGRPAALSVASVGGGLLLQNGLLVVRDSAAPITAASSCVAGSAHTVYCAPPLVPFCSRITLRGPSTADLGLAGCVQVSGSRFADTIRGGAGAEQIDTSGDRVADTVSCGAGQDSVTAGSEDRVAADCETVTRS